MRQLLATLFVLSIAIGATLAPEDVLAQKKTDASAEQRRAEQLRKLSAQNQQLESEKATLTKEKEDALAAAKLNEEKSKEAQSQSSKVSRELTGLRNKNSELEKTAQTNTAELQKLNAQLIELRETAKSQQTLIEQRAQAIAELTENNRKLQGQLREVTALSGTQKERNQLLTSELGSCSKNNVALVGLVDEVSDRYRKKSCADARSLLEPLVGLRRAEFERVAEEYRGKAGDERYVPPVLKP